MMNQITFVDPLAPRPYSGAPGQLVGLGGTETTLVRIAERLSRHMAVTVRQAARSGPSAIAGGVHYAGLELTHKLPGAPQAIVVVNSWKVALKLARMHPRARVLVWQHVFPGRHHRVLGPRLAAAGVEIVCVSATHARWIEEFIGTDCPRVRHIHNPIPDDLHPDATPRDPNLLLFASSPHKGLSQVFDRFEALRGRFPKLRLVVADPGYMRWPARRAPRGVLALGRLDQGKLVNTMRRALCLFYPQDQFAETFGLVIAEANAVGCPALLHRGLGANDEVASDLSQCIETTDPRAIVDRIASWRASDRLRPLATGRAEFRISAITERWLGLMSPKVTSTDVSSARERGA